MPTLYILHTTKNNRIYVKGEKIRTQIQRGTKKKNKQKQLLKQFLLIILLLPQTFFSIIMRQTTD